MFFNPKWLIRRLLAISHAAWQRLDNQVQSSLIEKCTAITISLTQRTDYPMHSTLISIICPPLHQIAYVAHVRAFNRWHSMPRTSPLVQDFQTTNSVLQEESQCSKVCMCAYTTCA